MAVIPDEIKDDAEPKEIIEYIKYMRENIEFWASARNKEQINIQTSISGLDDRVKELEEGN